MIPRVTISILACDAVEHTRACLKSVVDHSAGIDYELILTDNGSTDGTAELFEEVKSLKTEGSVTIVRNQENLGFIEPNKHALDLARGEYFVMLNNDARVPKRWLELLIQPLENSPKAALSGPEGSCCELTRDFGGIPGRKLDYLEGSCLCAKTSIMRRHGLFSDYLKFAYHEDSDLSLRMQEMGYTIHRVQFRIDHARETTSKRVPKVREYAEQNRKAMISRWSAWRRSRSFKYPVVIRRRASSGDVLLASSLVKAISERCPRAMILVETDAVAIFSGNPRVMRCRRSFSEYKHARVIDLDMAYENRPGKHIIASYAEVGMVGALELQTEFYIGGSFEAKAAKVLGHGTWIAIHAGPTTWEGKNWTEGKWRTLIDHLISVGWKVLLVGNKGYDLPCTIDQRGTTTVSDLAGLLRHCQLFCGLDSFPMHLAQSVGTPIVPLFGVTAPEFILTFGSAAYPVVSHPDHEFSGARHRVSGATHVPVGGNPMETIEVEKVIDRIEFAMSPEGAAV